MIKKLLAISLMLSFGTAYADPSATSGANSSAGSTAVVNNSPTVTNTAGSTSNSGVNLEAGAVTNSASTGASTAQNGNMTVTTGGTTLNFGSGPVQHIPPPAAFVPSSTGSVPQIFGTMNSTTNEKGIDFALFAARICPSKAVRGYDLVSRQYDGASGKTEIVFTPHLNYAKVTKKPPTNPWEERHGYQGAVEVEEVTPIFGVEGKYKCLGMMTITAKDKKAGEAPFSLVMSDASDFPLRNMEGFRKITLLSTTSVIAATKGVGNQGGGVGIGAGLSQFFDPVLGTIGASAGTSSGVTYPETKIGMTFLVLIEDQEEGVLISLQEKPMEATAKLEIPVSVTPAVAESKPAEPQTIVVLPDQTSTSVAKPQSQLQPMKKHLVKKVVPKKPMPVAIVAASEVVKCNPCIVHGTVALPPLKSELATVIQKQNFLQKGLQFTTPELARASAPDPHQNPNKKKPTITQGALAQKIPDLKGGGVMDNISIHEPIH